MKKALLTFCLLATMFTALSQPHISGRITLSEKWGTRVYVLRLDQIDLNFGILIDSISLSDSGEFNYSFQSDKMGGLLYKFILPPAGDSYRTVTGGTNDNFILLTIEEKDTIVLDTHADSLFYSLKIERGEMNKSLLAYRDHSKPFFDLIRTLEDSIAKNPDQREILSKRFVPLWMDQIEKIKTRITQTLDTATSTSVIMAGLCHLNSAYLGIMPSEIISKYIGRIEHVDIPIVSNTIKLSEGPTTNRIGVQLPSTPLKDIQGTEYSLHEITKKVTVIDFWASWCSPCRQANKKGLPEIYESIKARKDLQFISISIDEDWRRWKRAVLEDNPDWPQYIDQDRTLVKLLSAYGVPLYLVINEEKQVIFETMSHYHLEHFLKFWNKE